MTNMQSSERRVVGGRKLPQIPAPTGDYEKDCEAGRKYGAELVEFMASTGATNVMFAQAAFVMALEEHGIAVGFFHKVASLATKGFGLASSGPVPADL